MRSVLTSSQELSIRVLNTLTAIGLAVFGEWTPLVKFFFIMMGLDYISGTGRAFINGNWKRKLSLKGLAVKLMYLVVISAFYVLGSFLGGMHGGVFIRQLVLSIFIVHEFGSVLENVAGIEYKNHSIIPNQVIELAEVLVDKSYETLHDKE